MSYFKSMQVFVEGNRNLRFPQIESYLKIKDYFTENSQGEALVVLPTGTGKSGLICIAPFGVSNGRVLVITPGLVTKRTILKELVSLTDSFWLKHDIIFSSDDLPVVVEYDSNVLDSSLRKAHFVVTNIHNLQDNKNSLLSRVDQDFFDMIIIDESHHSAAATWRDALNRFPKAKKLHVTGTPYRGDGQEILGQEIHRTSLSDAMRAKFVKLLRKETINNEKLTFTVPNHFGILTLDEVKEFKESEWIEKSVALSKPCSDEVISATKKRLEELKKISPQVPHKILAVACSVTHAIDVTDWYNQTGLRAVLVHSKMDYQEKESNFAKIERNDCDVVVSVNMLMEGYDHRYLSVLGIFRPFKSANAFAQIIGRVLRVIPGNEITDYSIDNNAIVIYHQETGLDRMWLHFQKEVDKASSSPKDFPDPGDDKISESDYLGRANKFAQVSIDGTFTTGEESYLPDLDFHEMFRQAREKAHNKAEDAVQELQKSGTVSDEVLEKFREFYEREEMNNQKITLDQQMIELRPEMARQHYRDMLKKDADQATEDILEALKLNPKGNDLYEKLSKSVVVARILPTDVNNGMIAKCINGMVREMYGPVKNRDPELLKRSYAYQSQCISKLKRFLNV
ncbi:MAG: DEAD/DEAH box helicase [Candidatus Sericytochromatia bacterium]